MMHGASVFLLFRSRLKSHILVSDFEFFKFWNIELALCCMFSTFIKSNYQIMGFCSNQLFLVLFTPKKKTPFGGIRLRCHMLYVICILFVGKNIQFFIWNILQKRREEMERLEKERQAELRSYKGLMVSENMTSNKQMASASKSLQELEEDFMWAHCFDKTLKLSMDAYKGICSIKQELNIYMLLEKKKVRWEDLYFSCVVCGLFKTKIEMINVK